MNGTCNTLYMLMKDSDAGLIIIQLNRVIQIYI